LEVDGFKNLFDLQVDFGPYTCIAGPNAVGKSNVFDAIEFLALISDLTFMDAAQRLRSAGDRLGDPRTLFWLDADGKAAPMKLAAEMIVAATVEDDFGQEAVPSSTFLRYEVELAYVEPATKSLARMGSIKLVREDLNYIVKSKAKAHLGWSHSKLQFRDRLVKNKRFGTGYISTEMDVTGSTIQVHQDGGSRGQPRKSSAERTPRTVVSATNTSDDPTILAAKREMQQWRKLALEPTAMRAPDSVTESSTIAANGAHLAAALYRMSLSQDDVYARVASTASALTDVRAVEVDHDPTRDLFTLRAKLGPSDFLPARALSDGTLRFLALSIIEADDKFGGLICMEEPENGIHPAKISAMVELLHDLAVDPQAPAGEGNPIRQVIVNTHSPRFVALQDKDDLLLALPRSIMRDGTEIRTLDLLPMSKSWRRSAHGYAGSHALIVDYLTKPPGTLVELDYPERQIEQLD